MTTKQKATATQSTRLIHYYGQIGQGRTADEAASAASYVMGTHFDKDVTE